MIERDKHGVEYDIPAHMASEFRRWRESQNVPACEPWDGPDFSRYRVDSSPSYDGGVRCEP